MQLKCSRGNHQLSRVGERTGRLVGDPDARLNVYFTLVH